jgi:hypothetical protein
VNQQDFIVVIVVVIVFFLLFIVCCVKFAKWYISGSPRSDEPVHPLMAQMVSYSDGNEQQQPVYSDFPINQSSSTSTERITEHFYYQPVQVMPSVPHQPQSVAPAGEQFPIGPLPVRQDYGNPEYRVPAQPMPVRPIAPAYQPPVSQSVPGGPDDSAMQPSPVEYSEQEPTQPDTPYYQQPAQSAYYEPSQMPTLEDIYQGPVSDYDTAPDPEYFFFEESTGGAIGLLPIEPGLFEMPDSVDAPMASYPDMPKIVDAGPSAEQE